MDNLHWYNLFTNNVLMMVLPLCILIIISRVVAIKCISFRDKKITYIVKAMGYFLVALYICSYYVLSREGIMNISVLNGFTVLLCCLEIVDNICCIFEGSTSKEFDIDINKKLYKEIIREVRELRLKLIDINFDIKSGRTSIEVANKIKNINKLICMNRGKYLLLEDFLNDNLFREDNEPLTAILDNLRKTEILQKIINAFSDRVSYLENKIRDLKNTRRTIESI